MNSFEKELSTLQRKELPRQWREELLASTESTKSTNVREGSRTRNFGSIAKCAWGSIAACWIAAGIFHLNTPRNQGAAELAERYGVSEDRVHLLAARFFPDLGESRNSQSSNL